MAYYWYVYEIFDKIFEEISIHTVRSLYSYFYSEYRLCQREV